MAELREKNQQVKFSNRLRAGEDKTVRYTAFENGGIVMGTFASLPYNGVLAGYSLSKTDKVMKINTALLDFFRNAERNLDEGKALADSGVIKVILRFADLNGLTLEVPMQIKGIADEEKRRMHLERVNIRLALLRR